MFNESANKAYIQAHFEIEEEIKRLQNNLCDHNQTAVNINWGHVEDLKHILAQLKQINGEE